MNTMNTNERIAAAKKFSLAANKAWTSENRELLASFPQDGLWKSLAAWLQLEMRAEVENTEPSVEAYKAIISRGFLTLFDEGVIEPCAEISKLGMADLDRLRRSTGIGAESLPEPVVELTPEQKLEAEVIDDWANLPGDKIRAKKNSNCAYRAMLERLLSTDKLSPTVTAKVMH